MSYSQFAKRAASIKGEMTKAEVRAILGEPSVIWTDADPLPFYEDRETWAWGVTDRYSMATRGQITFSRFGKVDYFALPNSESLGEGWSDDGIETAIRKISCILSPGGPFSERFPGILERIRLVNYCVGLGEARASTALSLYGDLLGHGGNREVYSYLDLLYLPKDDTKLESSNPYTVIVDGTPISISSTTFFSGFMFPISQEVRRYRKERRFRFEPFEPSGNPSDYRTSLFETHKWKTAKQISDTWDSEIALRSVGTQIDDLLRTCYDPKSQGGLDEIKKHGVHWDRNRQAFVRNDGFFRPDPEVPTPFRYVGDLSGKVRFSIERRDPRNIYFTFSYPLELKRKPATLSIASKERSISEPIDFTEEASKIVPDHFSSVLYERDGIVHLRLNRSAYGASTVTIRDGTRPPLVIKIPNREEY